jgi:hypothetical protein
MMKVRVYMWVKRKCYVVKAWYRDELYESGETPMYEQDICISRSRAEKCREEYEADPDFEDVYMDEDVDEFWEHNIEQYEDQSSDLGDDEFEESFR